MSRYENWSDRDGVRVDYADDQQNNSYDSYNDPYYRVTERTDINDPRPRCAGKKCCPCRVGRLFEAPGSSPLDTLTLGEWWASKSSLFTIVTIYSIMNGATMHVMPGLFLKAGVLVASVLTVVVGLVCWYTCRLIFKIGANDSLVDDFSDCVKDKFAESSGFECVGEIGRYVALLASGVILVTVCLNYHFIILSHIMLMWPAAAAQCSPAGVHLCVRVVCMAGSALLLLLMSNLRLVILMQLSMLGALCFLGGVCVSLVEDGLELAGNPQPYSTFHQVLFYGESVNQLCGVLFVSFFIHNVILPIIKCQTNMDNPPELRERDVGVGYALVGLTYVVVGGVGALSKQAGADGDGAPATPGMLRAHSKPVYALLIAHACTFYPLLAVIFRQQVEKGLMRREGSSLDLATASRRAWRGFALSFLCNAAVVGTTSGLTWWLLAEIDNLNPATGQVDEEYLTDRISERFESLTGTLRWSGALCGIVYALILPLVVSLIIRRGATGALGCKYYVGYTLLLAVGTACVVLQFLPDFPNTRPRLI